MKETNKHDTALCCISAIKIFELARVLDLNLPTHCSLKAWCVGVFGQIVFLVLCAPCSSFYFANVALVGHHILLA